MGDVPLRPPVPGHLARDARQPGPRFFALALVLFALQIFIRPLRRLCENTIATSFSLIVVTTVLWLMLGTEGVKVIPASILREGLGMPRLSFSLINFAMDTFVTLGWLLIEFLYRKRERS